MFIMALPCINLVMILVWAIMGENQSRKNYFRALILWFLVWTLVWAALMALGFASEINAVGGKENRGLAKVARLLTGRSAA